MTSPSDPEDESAGQTWDFAEDQDELPSLDPDWPERDETAEDIQRKRDLAGAQALAALDEEETARAQAEWDASGPHWRSIGEALADGRVNLGLSKREAARRAGLSDGAWRHLEAGMKLVNRTLVYPNPRDENLVAAAQAVQVDPAFIFELARRPLPPGLVSTPSPDRILEDLRALSSADRKLVHELVRRLGS